MFVGKLKRRIGSKCLQRSVKQKLCQSSIMFDNESAALHDYHSMTFTYVSLWLNILVTPFSLHSKQLSLSLFDSYFLSLHLHFFQSLSLSLFDTLESLFSNDLSFPISLSHLLYLPIFFSISRSFFLSVSPFSLFHTLESSFSKDLSISLTFSNFLSFSLYLCLPFFLSVCLSLTFSVFISLSFFLYLHFPLSLWTLYVGLYFSFFVSLFPLTCTLCSCNNEKIFNWARKINICGWDKEKKYIPIY